MKNLVKNSFYTGLGIIFLGLNNVNANINASTATINEGIRTAGKADTVIQQWLSNLLGFLYLIAVLFAIWGGFNILTAAGDEDKVKKGKTVLIQAILGIVVIFIAGSLIDWLISSIVV